MIIRRANGGRQCWARPVKRHNKMSPKHNNKNSNERGNSEFLLVIGESELLLQGRPKNFLPSGAVVTEFHQQILDSPLQGAFPRVPVREKRCPNSAGHQGSS